MASGRRKILTPKEAAEELGVISERTLETWRREYRNTSVLKGPKWLDIEGKIGYPIDELEAYKKRCELGGGSDSGFAA